MLVRPVSCSVKSWQLLAHLIFSPSNLQVKIKLLLSKYQIQLSRKLQSPTTKTKHVFIQISIVGKSTNHFQFQAWGTLQVVRLSFPNFANSFQKYHNFYTTQQNVSHPSPLFLTHFWERYMHQSTQCWQMLLSSLTILQITTPQSLLADATRMKSLWEIPPAAPLTYCLQNLDWQTERWNLIRSLLLLPYNILRLLLYHMLSRVRRLTQVWE